MSSRASRRNDTTDIIKKIQNDNRRNQGLARQAYSGLASAEYGSSTANSGGVSSGSGESADTTGLLKTAGDTMVGPLAFYPVAKILASGVLDISLATGAYTSRVIATGEGAAADDLDTITGAAHAGQILFLQATATTAITLKHATGNIYMPSGSDYTIAGKEIVILQWDTINTTWTLVSNTGGSGGGVGLADTNIWTGVNSFTSITSFSVSSPQIYLGDQASDTINITGQVNLNGDIDMNTNDITSLGDIGFDVIGGQITADAGATGMNFVTTSDVPFRFTPNTTNVLDINDGGIDMIAGDIDLNNLNIIGVNNLNFNTTGQQITDNANGLRFVMTDSTDTFDFTTDSNLNMSIEKYFINMQNSRIQMTQEVAPSAPAATKHYVYVDSTSGELSILHPTGAAVSLEGGGGGSTSFVGFTADDILDMATYDIERVGQIEFNTTSHYIKSNSVGFEYRVPVGDTHEFFINGVSELLIESDGTTLGGDLDLATNDIQNVDQLNFEVTGQRLNSTTSSIQYEVPSGDSHKFLVSSTTEMTVAVGAVTVTNDLTVTDNTTLGTYGGGHETNVNGKIDFRENYSATNQTASDSDGYIDILVGGVAKKLYYY